MPEQEVIKAFGPGWNVEILAELVLLGVGVPRAVMKPAVGQGSSVELLGPGLQAGLAPLCTVQLPALLHPSSP